MEGLPEINRNAAQNAPVESAVGAPPPPTEVKIRTMRSDLAGLAASGGGLPHFENVKVSGLSLEEKTMDASQIHKKGALAAIIITVIALVVLAVLGYLAYRILA